MRAALIRKRNQKLEAWEEQGAHEERVSAVGEARGAAVAANFSEAAAAGVGRERGGAAASGRCSPIPWRRRGRGRLRR